MSREPDNDNGFGEWGGYMDAKISKLEEQFAQSSSYLRQSNLFAGISIFVNGLTNPSADELKRTMMVHGGIFHHYQRSHTTYVIASNLPDVKVRNMNTSKIIKPDWVVDCLKAGKILDYTRYLLYTNHKPSQPKLFFKKTEKTETGEDEKTIDEDAQCLDVLKELDEIKEVESKPVAEAKSETQQPPDTFNPPTAESKPITSTKFAKSAIDPNFLSEFYNNSRLHHIATLGAGFKEYVSELREKHDGVFSDREHIQSKLSQNKAKIAYPQIIMHIDMDCFFVSVGLRSRPHLRGEPVAVTHSKGGDAAARPGMDRQKERELYLKRLEKKSTNNYMQADKISEGFAGTESLSEIASCSYEARKMGVRNGMFVGQAMKLCPRLKTIPYDFEEYRDVAFTLYNTVAQYTLNIEAVSCDEMFVDLAEVLNDIQVETMEFVRCIRDEVKAKTQCPCSAGVGGNRLQARMATKKAKPDGQYFLSPENVEEYMTNIKIDDLPGVGYSTSYTLEQLGWKTCGDLQRIPMGRLQQEFGKKFGETLYQSCRGIDNRPLVYGQVRKSISAEVNYGIRFTEFEELDKFLRQLCGEVHSRLMKIKRRGKCITLKLMVRAKEAPVETSKFMGHGYCDNLTKSTTLSDYTCDVEVITKTILSTVKSLNIPPQEMRGIGIHISKLDDAADAKPKSNVLKAMLSKVAERQKETAMSAAVAEKIEKKSPEKRKSPAVSPAKKPAVAPAAKKTRGKTKTGKTIHVGDMLQKAAAKRKPVVQDFGDIDMTVLAELPEEIREEILRERKRFATSSNSVIQVPHNEAVQGPNKPQKIIIETPQAPHKNGNSPHKNELENSKESLEPTQSDNIFEQPNCRQLIESWVESSESPEFCDIDIFAQNAQELIQRRRIVDLYVPLRLLYRIIFNKKSCAWHAAYKNILNVVQNEMVASYGSKMFLQEGFECDCKLTGE